MQSSTFVWRINAVTEIQFGMKGETTCTSVIALIALSNNKNNIQYNQNYKNRFQ